MSAVHDCYIAGIDSTHLFDISFGNRTVLEESGIVNTEYGTEYMNEAAHWRHTVYRF